MFPVMIAKAGRGFVERIEADPKNWATPERRWILSVQFQETPTIPDHTAMLILRQPPDVADYLAYLNQTRQVPRDPLFIFDARTPEERAAADYEYPKDAALVIDATAGP
jgi:hypothetical protein